MPKREQKPAEDAYDAYMGVLRERQRETPTELIEGLLPVLAERSLQEILTQLDTLKGWLDSFRPLPPSVVSELKHLYDVRFTYHSNALEGNTLTQSETELVLEKGITIGGKSLVEHLEVIGHKDAMDYMEELAQKKIVLNEWEIRNLHNLILRGIDRQEAGRYRTLDVKAAGTEHTYPPHYRLPELMADFAGWLQKESAQALHPVEYAAEAHYRLVFIHPFRDGNGRTARLLMNLLLLQQGYPVAVITKERREEYIEALVYGQSHQDDTEPLTYLVAEACRVSFVEHLRILSTAGESRGHGMLFYAEMLASQQRQA